MFYNFKGGYEKLRENSGKLLYKAQYKSKIFYIKGYLKCITIMICQAMSIRL